MNANILIGVQVFCWPKIRNQLGHKTILRPKDGFASCVGIIDIDIFKKETFIWTVHVHLKMDKLDYPRKKSNDRSIFQKYSSNPDQRNWILYFNFSRIGVHRDGCWIDTSISYLCCHVACHKCALVLVNLKCQNQVVCVPVLSQSGPFTSLVVCVLQWFTLRRTLSFFMVQN